MICKVCGTSNDQDAAFCVTCGGSLRRFQYLKGLLSSKGLYKTFLLHPLPFLQSLADASFHHRMSFRMIKRTYGLSILFAGLIALLLILTGFHLSRLLGMIVLLVGAPLIFLLIVLYSRLLLEMVLLSTKGDDRATQKVISPEAPDEIEWKL